MIKIMKRYLICFLLFVLCTISGCNQIQMNSKQIEEYSGEKDEEKKEKILAAFQFWINKSAWLYEHSMYIDVQKEIEVYCEKQENNEYLGYLYLKTEDGYKEITFLLSDKGYQSKPLSEEDVKNIKKGLIYLGKEKFFYAKEDIEKPKFPKSSEKKNKFIQMAKKEITELLTEGKNEEKVRYRVYILDFTNVDTCAQVIVIANDTEMWLGEVLNQITLDDGTVSKDIAYFTGGRGPIIDWTDEENRKDFEKELELAICQFDV